MARSANNLNAVLQDTADAIKAKKGSTTEICPRDFADEITNLPSGGTGNIEVHAETIVEDYATVTVRPTILHFKNVVEQDSNLTYLADTAQFLSEHSDSVIVDNNDDYNSYPLKSCHFGVNYNEETGTTIINLVSNHYEDTFPFITIDFESSDPVITTNISLSEGSMSPQYENSCDFSMILNVVTKKRRLSDNAFSNFVQVNLNGVDELYVMFKNYYGSGNDAYDYLLQNSKTIGIYDILGNLLATFDWSNLAIMIDDGSDPGSAS